MAKMNKVCVNLDQSNANNGGFTDAEKAQARANIGAGTSNLTIVHDSNTLPPVTTNVSQMTIFDDGRTRFDNLYKGIIPYEPNQSESGQVLVANYAGSPAKGTGQWKDVHNIGIREVPSSGSNSQVLTWNDGAYAWADAASDLPAHTVADAGKILTVNSSGNAAWQTPTASGGNKGVYEFTVTKVLDGTSSQLWTGEGLTSADISETFVNCTSATCPVHVGLDSYGGLRVSLDISYNSITCESHTYVSSNANFATELGMWGFDDLCQVVAGMNRTWFVTHGASLDQNGIRSTTETLKSGTLTIKFDFVFEV